jgi:nicotinate phosphoribosyltransferase
VALCDRDKWIPALKVSESPDKTPNPGHKLAWRIYDSRGKATSDLLSLDDEDPRKMATLSIHHPSDARKFRTISQSQISEIEPLLVNILDEGKMVYEFPSLEAIRKQRQADVDRLDVGVKRLINPHIYHVSLTNRLWQLKTELIERALGHERKAGQQQN